MTDLRQAAQAVLDRWNSPHWEWVKNGPTADLMHALREALAAPMQEPVAVFDERLGEPVLLSGAPMLSDGQPLYTAPPAPMQDDAELRRLHQRVSDYEADAKAVMAEDCAGDELHCSCVPHLRQEIKKLQAENEALRADAERLKWIITEWVIANQDGIHCGKSYPSARDAIDAERSKT